MQENDFCGLCQVSESQVKLVHDRFLLGSWSLQMVCELRSSRHCGAALLIVNVRVSHLGILLKCRVDLSRAEEGWRVHFSPAPGEANAADPRSGEQLGFRESKDSSLRVAREWRGGTRT